MKNRIKKLITLGVLSITLTSNFFVSYAIDKPVKPEKPIEKVTNKKIKQYNTEVDIYNEAVDAYNQAIDAEYEAAVAETAQKNAEIEQHNQEEEAKAVTIAEQNAAIQEQYNKDLEQYNKDKAIEDKIIAAGYESVEAYNDMIENKYNAQANYSVEANSSASSFSIDNSYTIESSEEPSENTFHVYIEHEFDGNSFSTELDINENDTITFYAAGAQFEPTEPGYCTFYMNTDDEHTMGYWMLTYSECLENAVNYSNGEWNNGDVHRISFNEGTVREGDTTDVDMIYHYTWIPLQIYPTYNIPVEPTLNLIEFTPDILDKLPDPVKGEYLEHLEYMDLIKEKPEPEPEEPEEQEPPKEDIPDEPTPTVSTPTPTPEPTSPTEVLGATRSETSEKQVLGARRAATGDPTDIVKRYTFIIGCIGLIGLIIVVDISRKKKS